MGAALSTRRAWAVVQLMTVTALHRSGQPLPRDVILLATADEETGGRAGAGRIVQHRPDLLGECRVPRDGR